MYHFSIAFFLKIPDTNKMSILEMRIVLQFQFSFFVHVRLVVQIISVRSNKIVCLVLGVTYIDVYSTDGVIGTGIFRVFDFIAVPLRFQVFLLIQFTRQLSLKIVHPPEKASVLFRFTHTHSHVTVSSLTKILSQPAQLLHLPKYKKLQEKF